MSGNETKETPSPSEQLAGPRSDALDDSAFPEIVQAAALGLGALGRGCPSAAKARLADLARSDEPSAVAARRAAAQCGR